MFLACFCSGVVSIIVLVLLAMIGRKIITIVFVSGHNIIETLLGFFHAEFEISD